jgi:hypothetical protein
VASGLVVNPTGKPHGWFAVDLACEFINRFIKDQWSYRQKSTFVLGGVDSSLVGEAPAQVPIRVSPFAGHTVASPSLGLPLSGT